MDDHDNNKCHCSQNSFISSVPQKISKLGKCYGVKITFKLVAGSIAHLKREKKMFNSNVVREPIWLSFRNKSWRGKIHIWRWRQLKTSKLEFLKRILPPQKNTVNTNMKQYIFLGKESVSFISPTKPAQLT